MLTVATRPSRRAVRRRRRRVVEPFHAGRSPDRIARARHEGRDDGEDLGHHGHQANPAETVEDDGGKFSEWGDASQSR